MKPLKYATNSRTSARAAWILALAAFSIGGTGWETGQAEAAPRASKTAGHPAAEVSGTSVKKEALEPSRLQQYQGRLESMTPAAQGQALRLRLEKDGSTPVFVSGRFLVGAKKEKPTVQASRFLSRLLSASPDRTLARALVQTASQTDALGYTHVSYQQQVGSYPVLGAEYRVHVNPAGEVTSANGHLATGVRMPRPARVGAEQALTLASDALEKELADPARPPLPDSALDLTPRGTPRLVVLAGPTAPPSGGQALAYELSLGRWQIYIDAHSGEPLRRSLTGDAVTVETYTADGGYDIPGVLVASNNPPYTSAQIDAEEAAAHAYALEYASYLDEAFGRSSIDARGLTLEQTIQSEDMANAYWDGYRAVFGPGWATRDIVGHEFTHGLTDYTANLEYSGASGALNESFSDIFAVMIDRDDWLQGEEADGFSTDNPVRSLSDPHKGNRFHPNQSYNQETNSGQPAHMDEYLTASDALCGSTGDSYNGCVHFNSGIQNHAAYLMAEGAVRDSLVIARAGRSDTEQVFYRTLATRLTSTSDLEDARDNSLEACRELFGEGASACGSAQNAWAAVGVGQPFYHTLQVALDGSGDFTSIQAAIQAADLGDHIQVAEGLYQEALVLGDKSVVIEGAGQGHTVVQSPAGAAALSISGGSDPVVVRGLTLKGVAGGALDEGGVVACLDSSLILDQVEISGGEATYGGGIWSGQCQLTLQQASIWGNSSSAQGGGIFQTGGLLQAQDVTISQNQTLGSGGGLYLAGEAILDSVVVSNNEALEGAGLTSEGTLSADTLTLSQNIASFQGGGAYLWSGSAELRTFTVRENQAAVGGGILVLEDAGMTTVSLMDGQIEGNQADTLGGGLAVYGDVSGTLAALTVAGNSAESGGGLALLDGYSLDVSNLILSGNSASEGGGILLGGGSAPDLSYLTVVDNRAPVASGLLVDDTASALLDSSIVAFNQGGAPLVKAPSASLTVSYSDVLGGAPLGGTNLSVDPAFVSFSGDLNSTNDDLHLASGSACRNAGNPATAQNDPDGTRSDMGAYGGPSLLSWPLEWVPCYGSQWQANLGGSITSSLDSRDPSNGPRGSGYYYEATTIYLRAGVPLTLNLTASFDAYLYLYSPECDYLMRDDDSGPGTDSYLTYTVQQDGYYSIIATSYDPGAVGSYTLSIR